MNTPAPIRRKQPIPRTVWALGLVSLFMDLSSELIHALLPIYLVTTMGMSVVALGVLEGAAEATAMIVKVFSGAISDWLGRRKGLLLVGYGLAALTKPLFPLASTPAVVVVARLLDRVGKGIRGAPRDALVADVAPPEIRGACFGLRQSMDTVGAFLGPMCAIVLMLGFADHIRIVMWFAVVPAFVAIALIVFGVREPEHAAPQRGFRSPLHWRALREFPRAYWFVVAGGAAFTLARFSEAFLVLRAQQTGLDAAWIPGVMVVMSIAYALSAWPVGVLSDRMDRRMLLAAGMVLLIAADLLLGLGASMPTMFAGVAVWGLHMGFTQGILAAMVSETSPAALRGTAFGVFNLVSGICMLLASSIAGALWTHFGASTTFVAGAALVVVPLALCRFMPRVAPPAA
ncbi:MFS transporter [Burkholderia vietnamiensis]|uniref:MFS transporter n=1 Tax=Burkholderia vietnamiensis TaxID=60552 RepID=UPI0006211A71|nr:MFS transporter [Burkholderia vietnamiensis]AOJ97834.1 MFS transporter [Burkholderia vietnamiensis]KKI37577.1 MFS transporter [Burkholderia vietnamiensis]KVF79004.1 MFS transporter [Burkholderia vietnamiensis]KVF86319.1 MFS transporter [Burkholderia vietnamiensis]KVF87557.1 MFS transporter [Burkholderia vietnamiensis]